MSNYGKTIYYRIEDVDFRPLQEVVIPGYEHIFDYYKKKYNLTLNSAKQPLLVTLGKRKDEKILLLPEIMLMTGIPENFDEQRRKAISQQTIR